MKIILLLLIIVVSNLAIAQSCFPVIPLPWENQYNFQEYDFAADVCAGFGGGCIIVGGDWENSSYDDMRCRITKLFGQRQIWTTWHDLSDNYPVYEGVCRNEIDETYVVIGTHDFNVTDRELIIHEYDQNGNLIQSKWYDDYDRGIDIIQLRDGGYAALVQKYDNSTSTIIPFVMRLDDSFNIIWETPMDLGDFHSLSSYNLPGNALCLSQSGNYIFCGFSHVDRIYCANPPAFHYWDFYSLNRFTVSNGTIDKIGQDDTTHRRYIGTEYRNSSSEYVVVENVSNNKIAFRRYDGDLNALGTPYNYIVAPSGYDKILAYEFESCASGYFVVGMVRDMSGIWHMWNGIVDNSFVLDTFHVGVASSGSFGEVYPELNQMGGCVTEYGNFIAVGAYYLSSGHTHYNVMFQTGFPNGSIAAEAAYSDRIEITRPENDLQVSRISGTSDLQISYTGNLSEQPLAHVYDISGRQVRTLHGEESSYGSFSFAFDGLGNDGDYLPSGVYVVTVNNDESVSAASFTFLQ